MAVQCGIGQRGLGAEQEALAADVGLRRTGLFAIATLRRDQPLEFLLSLTKAAIGLTARDAIAALGLYRHDDAVRERVQGCVAQRQDIDLRAAFAEAF